MTMNIDYHYQDIRRIPVLLAILVVEVVVAVMKVIIGGRPRKSVWLGAEMWRQRGET